MTVDPLLLALVVAAIACVGLAYWKFGWKGAAAALAAVAGLAALVLRKKPVAPVVIAPPLPDKGTKVVHDAAAQIVTEHAETERAEIHDAVTDGPRLAAHLRKMK